MKKEISPLAAISAFLIPFSFLIFTFAPDASCAEPAWAEKLAKIPVQQGGRVKPFETFAREALLYVTGKTSWQKQSAVETAWSWIAAPQAWTSQPLIYVGAPEIREEFGMKLIRKRVSAEIVFEEKSFSQKVSDAIHRREKKESLSFNDKKRIEIYERAVFLSQLGGGALPGWVPEKGNPRGAWMSFSDFVSAEPAEWMRALPREEMEIFKSAAERFAAIFHDESAGEEQKNEAAENFKQALEALWARAGMTIDQGALGTEIFYNRLHAFGRGAKLYLMAAVFFFVAFIYGFRRKRERDYPLWIGLGIYTGAILMHIAGFYLRCIISGRAPVTNMYESIVWVSLAAAIFALPIYFYLRNIVVLIMSSGVAALGLIVAESFPAVLDPALSPLVPVLRSNLWLTVHVLTITMSYGAFALAWALGHWVVFGYAFREKTESLVSLANAVYRAIQIGVILLAAGTVLGGVWANYSWGRFWGWDPKETWALIALLGYLIVLHARFMGWIESFGIAMGAVLAFMGIVMAWYGVNFVLAAGLHSYGFGGGGYSSVSTAVLIDLAFVAAAGWFYRKKMRSSK